MDLRSQTSLLGSLVCFAIAASVLLRPRRLRVHWIFTLFDLTVGGWYLTSFLQRTLAASEIVTRVNLVFAVLLPLAAVQFFRAFLEAGSQRSSQLNRVASALAAGMVAVVLSMPMGIELGTAVFAYVFVLLAAGLFLLYRAGSRARSRVDGARLTYLALVGALAAVFTLAEYLPYFGVEIPPVGTLLILIFLYVLSQSILRYRVLDLYELAGRLTVLTALSFLLAFITWVLAGLDPGNFYLPSVAAALVLLLVFDPVRTGVEQRIAEIFFRERHDFERMAEDLRRQLAHVLSIDDLARKVVAAFLGSRRLTHGAIYLADAGGSAYVALGHVGPEPVARVEVATARALLERLEKDDVVVLGTLERERESAREVGDEREVRVLEEIIRTLGEMNADVCTVIRGERAIYGLLCVRDERMRDAFIPEEVGLLRALGAQAAVAVENARLYERLKERDRLATLGEMAAGLAHEIRNPLGAIKASAQFLAEPGGEAKESHEFLGIIVEEVDRLNRVVGSFLDYARPGAPPPAEPVDVNATVHRTLQFVAPEITPGVQIEEDLARELPRVAIDAERLRQVLLNLAQNAVQAMSGKGRLTMRTRVATAHAGEGARRAVEVVVEDSGPGIPEHIRRSLFVPFVTTKERGTGLGLAISQRIVSAAGGSISAHSSPEGATFVVRLPATEPPPEAAAAEPGAASAPEAAAGAPSD